jgi:hypothetical protein
MKKRTVAWLHPKWSCSFTAPIHKPKTISQLSFKLNQVGLSNYFDMGRGPIMPEIIMRYQIIE